MWHTYVAQNINMVSSLRGIHQMNSHSAHHKAHSTENKTERKYCSLCMCSVACIEQWACPHCQLLPYPYLSKKVANTVHIYINPQNCQCYLLKRSPLGQVLGSSKDQDNHGVGSEQLRATQLNAEKLVRTKAGAATGCASKRVKHKWARLKAGAAPGCA